MMTVVSRWSFPLVSAPLPSFNSNTIVELLGPNFQQKFAFWGRSMKFGVEILLIILYLKIDRSKSF